MDVRQIGRRVRSEREHRASGTAFSSELRAAAAAYAAEQREMGRRWVDIEAEVHVSRTSLREWMRMAQSSGFAELQVVDAEPKVSPIPVLILTSPNGFTVTGAALEDVARLLMAVG